MPIAELCGLHINQLDNPLQHYVSAAAAATAATALAKQQRNTKNGRKYKLE